MVRCSLVNARCGLVCGKVWFGLWEYLWSGVACFMVRCGLVCR